MADQKRTSTKCSTSHDSDGVKLGPAERWNAIVSQIEEKAIKDAEGRLYSGDTDSEDERKAKEKCEEEDESEVDSDIEMEDRDEGLTEAEKLYHDELWKAKFPGTLMAQSYGSDDEDEDGDWATDSEDGVGKESLLEEDDSEADDWEVDEDASEDDWEENELQSYATSSVLRSGNARYKA